MSLFVENYIWKSWTEWGAVVSVLDDIQKVIVRFVKTDRSVAIDPNDIKGGCMGTWRVT
jgi:hypothetical protein